jgi:hypothetical protein
MRSASTFSTPRSIALSRSQKVQVPLFGAVIKVGHAPEVPLHGQVTIASARGYQILLRFG